MESTKSHWTSCIELAKGLDLQHSLLYAKDHVDAVLEFQRAMIKPQRLSKEEWIKYKDVNRRIEYVQDLLTSLINLK